MTLRVHIQCSGVRWDLSSNDPTNEKEVHFRKRAGWVTQNAVFTEETVTTVIRDLENAIEKAADNQYCTTHGWYRLILIRGEDEAMVTLSDGRVIDLNRRVLAGPYRQGADKVSEEDRAAIRRALLGDVAKVPEESPLPVLDETPVPAGTVVEVLDAWGLPTGSTEVT